MSTQRFRVNQDMNMNAWDDGLDAVYLAALKCEPRIGAKYRHFNGEVYIVQCLVIDEETTGVRVVFHKLGRSALLVRDLEAWKETVEQKVEQKIG